MRDFIGVKLPPHQVEVEKGALRFFAKAVGEANPIYLDETVARAAGFGSLPAPPTYAFSLTLMKDDPFDFVKALGLDIRRILHGEQAFEYVRPICAGDVITLSSEIVDAYEKKGGALQFIVLEVQAHNQSGQLASRLRNTIVVRN